MKHTLCVLSSIHNVCTCTRILNELHTTHHLLSGVHNVCVWRPTSRRDGWTEDSGLGPEEHGIRPATPGVQPQIPNPLYPLLPQQAGLRPQLHRRQVWSHDLFHVYLSLTA